jgi:hypothetical protein
MRKIVTLRTISQINPNLDADRIEIAYMLKVRQLAEIAYNKSFSQEV